MDDKGNIYPDTPARPVTAEDERRLQDYLAGEAKDARRESLERRLEIAAAEREARRPDVVDVVARLIGEQIDGARRADHYDLPTIAEVLLEEIGEMLLFDESALEHAEPVVEHAVEAAISPQHPEAALAPPRMVARSTIAAAMKAIRFPDALFGPRGPQADEIFDAFAVSALRCGWKDDQFVCNATRVPASISRGYPTWAYHLVVTSQLLDHLPWKEGRSEPLLAIATVSAEEFGTSPEFVEHAVRAMCEQIGHAFVAP